MVILGWRVLTKGTQGRCQGLLVIFCFMLWLLVTWVCLVYENTLGDTLNFAALCNISRKSFKKT